MGLSFCSFLAEAVDEQDAFDNPILKDGDVVEIDNCGFHHARHVEPMLRDMLANCGITLVYQPPYHAEYNTCEMCFWHRKFSKLA